MKEITVTSTTDQIKPVTDFVNSCLMEMSCSEDVRVDIDIAIDEIFGNIIRYAYHPDTGPVTLQVDTDSAPSVLVLTFIDRGIPYDPLKEPPPDLSIPLRFRPIGGLGIFVARNIMDKISYRYENGQNILSLTKKI